VSYIDVSGLICCPDCRGTLDDDLSCSGCGRVYPMVAGRPVFIGEEVEIRPLDHMSNVASEEIVRWAAALGGPILHLGAGATPERIPNTVEAEYALFRNTDVAVDAHRLPFRDGAFTAVLTLNTFEHLRDPAQAASELRRVLRPGGELWLQTAWLQPLHEAPAHFYGATEYGVRAWFSGWDIDRIYVPGNMQPVEALSWMASDLLFLVGAHRGPEAQAAVASLPLLEVARGWADRASRTGPAWEVLRELPQDAARHLAAGWELRARAPAR